MIGWWTLRPRDEGRGYNGFHLSIADNGILKPTWFEDDTLEGVIGKALDFVRETWPERFDEPGERVTSGRAKIQSSVREPGRIAPPRKRVVKRT